MIVLLNGTSSAGKTTLAKALQDALPTPYVLLGLDAVFHLLPRRYVTVPQYWQELFTHEYDGAGHISRVTPTAFGHRVVAGLHAAVAGLAGQGLDVVVDHVVFDRTLADDLVARWAGLHVLKVKVHCPRAVVEERERDRRDRTLGQAGALYDVVHAHLGYDLTVDTSAADPAGCAGQIAARLTGCLDPAGRSGGTGR